MKNMIFFGLLFCFIFQGCYFGLPRGKVTAHVIDETGATVEDAAVSVVWTRPKSLDPWDGHVSKGDKGTTDRNGRFSSSNTGFDNIAIRANAHGMYESVKLYKFTDVKMGFWQPWNPEITLRIRKIENPIPMYAKRFLQLVCPAEKVGYDLMKGDFVEPHGKGEITDCVISIHRKDIGKRKSAGYRREQSVRIKFSGDFNGIEPVLPSEWIRESRFYWPRKAYDRNYEAQEFLFQRSYSLAVNESSYYKEVYGTNTFLRTPDTSTFFFRIRSEKYPDGTFKSALYGKITSPDVEIYVDPVDGKTEYRLKNFVYYINPTRNDRNMEFDTKENLMYSHRKIWYETDKWVIDPRAYKNGEQGVSAP